jgi:multiple sugar transport system substrate-binding protein
MKNRSLFVLFSILVVMMLVLSACGTTTAETSETPAEDTTSGAEAPAVEPVTVTYWHTMSDAEEAQLLNVIAAFEAENPDIIIEPTRYAYADYQAALLTALAGGDVPDVVRMDIVWVSQFAEQGALLELDTAMSNFSDLSAAVFPGPLATNYYNGHYYGLPQNTNTQVLLWNRDLFTAAGLSEPPATMEEFAADACALSDAATGVYGYAEGGTYFWAPAPVFYAMGGEITDSEVTTATGYINGEASVAAFQMLTDLYNQGCLSPNLLGGGIATDAGLATNIYGMIIDGPWMVGIYDTNYPEFEVNFAPVPTGPDGTTSSVVGGEDVVVFAGTDQQEAALRWVNYLMSEGTQLSMAEVGMIPTLSSLTGNETLPAYFQIFMEQLATAQARTPTPVWSDIDNAINNAYTRMLNGDQTVQEALDQAAEEINALLAGN